MALIKPPVLPVWADTGDKTQPTSGEIQVGWPASNIPPSRQRFNWILNFLANGVRYLTRRGLPDWAADETYQIGDRAQGPDGKSYVSLANSNINFTPASNPGVWAEWGMLRSAFGALAWLNIGALLSNDGNGNLSVNLGQGVKNDGSGNLTLKLADNSLRVSASGVQASEPIATIAANQNITTASHFTNFVATANVTFSLAQASTLWNGFCFGVYAKAGSVTLSPYAGDSVAGATTYTFVKGASGMVIRDDAGAWTITPWSSVVPSPSDLAFQIGQIQ